MKLINLPIAKASGWKWYAHLKRYRTRWALVGMGLLMLWVGNAFWRCLPAPLFSEPPAALLLDRAGGVLAARIAADEQWRFNGNGVIPEKYRRAVIQFEDRRFAYHPGVDPLAVARALRQNFNHSGIVSGASTLSMQVIRLSRRGVPRSYREKLIEMVQALRLELRYSKDEIFALYAGHAPFGGNIVGLEAASRRYFSRPPSQLSWSEASLLAVLPNNPALLHPGRGRIALQAKRDRLLHRLQSAGLLSALDLRLALAEPLPARPPPLPMHAPHLLDTLIQQKGGPGVFESTVDGDLQQALNAIAGRHGRRLQAMGVNNLALLVLDNQRSEVLAYLGNLPEQGVAEQGRAVDIVQRARSTGSLLKPFLYALMLQHGEILPTTLVPDLPTRYGGYMPENYDHAYRGAVPARQALARSLNVPAVRMLQQYGVGRFYDGLRDLGLTTLARAPDDYGLTLILGGAEGTLWELTAAYGNLTRRARAVPALRPTMLRANALTVQHAAPGTLTGIIGPGAAWLTLDALLEVARPDTEQFWRQFTGQRPIAWKTGTSYGLRDAWAIGSDARYTVGVWAGNASGEGRAGLTGINAAAPVLFDVFNRLPAADWVSRPEADLKSVTVCAQDGYLANDLCATEQQWAPRDSFFKRQTPHFHLVHLDYSARYQVHSQCAATADMRHVPWFELPAGQAFFYRRQHGNYHAPPPYRADCLGALAGRAGDNPIDLLYPTAYTRLYIPRDLAGVRSRTVFRAAHRDARAILYWHLDDVYLGATDTFHELALDITPGAHRLTLVDGAGNRLVRSFQVLGITQDPEAL